MTAVRRLRERFPDLVDPPSDDICYASQNRQNAVQAIAARADLVLVVGSANSSNSVRMVEVAQRAGTPSYLVADPQQLDQAWFSDVSTVGVSSGASAPEYLIDQLLGELAKLGYRDVETLSAAVEDVVFSMPPQSSRRSR
jgi:4-hydroxy-3-methylbut-2-enyl diphosphate reductase